MRHTYRTSGTCSRSIAFDLEGNVVTNVVFEGGCNGNLQGIARAAEGMTVERLHELFACPDQLAQAGAAAFGEEREEQ